MIMKKMFFVSAFFIAVLSSSPATCGARLSDVEQQIRQRLDKMGLTGYVLDLNVQVPVPGLADQPPVTLWATVIRPASDKKLPTILMATPYRREDTLPLAERLLLHEYNLMILDIRGTGSSEGKWTSFDLVEQYDTASVIDQWIPGQNWSDGRVGMIGPSYCGIIQLLAAGRIAVDSATGEPVHLKAIMASEVMSDAYRDIVMQGGNLDLGFIPLWLGDVDRASIQKPLLMEDAGFPPDRELVQQAIDIVQSHYEQVPVTVGWVMDLDNAVDGPFYDKRSPMIYWPVKPPQGWGFDESNSVIPAKLPVFLSSGWFDIFLRGTLNNYAYGLSRHAASDKALLVGQWYHGDGAILEGIAGFESGDVQARWFDWKIKGVDDPFMTEFPVLLYVMGENRWRAEKSWPLPASRLEENVFFLSRKKSSLISHDWFSIMNSPYNFLLTEEPDATDYAGETPVLFHDPSMLHGRQSRSSVRWGGAMFTSAFDTMLDERDDELGVLTFTTEPLARDLETAGPLLLSFWAKTSFDIPAVKDIKHDTIERIKRLFKVDANLLIDLMDREDVQWVVELNDVFPDGQAKNITSGWLSAWHRPYDPGEASDEKIHSIDPAYAPFDPFYIMPDKNPRPIREGELYPYVIELWPCDNVFKAGHRIRISISASDFPHLLPIMRPSLSTLVIDSDHPARLDFTSVSTVNEGIDWEWIEDVDAYLLKKSDQAVEKK